MSEALHQFVQMAAHSFGVKPRDILSRDKHEPIATARKVAMVLVSNQVGYSAAGRFFGRNHVTVMSAKRSTEDALVKAVADGRSVVLNLNRAPESKLSQHRISMPICPCGKLAEKRDGASHVCSKCLEIEARNERHLGDMGL